MYKSKGETCGMFLQRCKRELSIPETIKIAFSGRLDPMAHGTMLLLTEDDSKNIKSFHNMNKTYEFEFVIGFSTDTTDILGLFNNYTYNNDISIELIIDYILSYQNKTFQQKYHNYSSYTVQTECGKKPLWWIAKHMPSKLPHVTKQVTIYSVNDVSFSQMNTVQLQHDILERIHTFKQNLDNDTFRTEEIINQWTKLDLTEDNLSVIKCKLSVSSGFYIRQFVQDISDKFGVKMMVINIHRIDVY